MIAASWPQPTGASKITVVREKKKKKIRKEKLFKSGRGGRTGNTADRMKRGGGMEEGRLKGERLKKPTGELTMMGK